ncbi:hypothetical protein ASE75_00560 [Sphingomonas sp. Leaf17]|nr:hypothetical protein ASE75_00560 [Sphingomonas sp. Leaf17]
MFLDFDGTLVELAETPDGVVVDAELNGLLAALPVMLGGRVAIVTGRSIAQIDALLGMPDLPVAGSHGAEQRVSASHDTPQRPPALDAASAAFRGFANRDPHLVVEDKSLGTALHYRQSPGHEGAARALAEGLAASLDLVVQHGKMMVELRAPGDKGRAIAALMAAPPFAGTVPVFLGDDLTDEDGFVAVAALGGTGILVGPPRDTAATARLDGVADVRRWLMNSLEHSA